MQAIASLIAELLLVAAVISAVQLLVLVFRNPRRPGWLRRNAVESIAVLGIVAGIVLSESAFVAGLVGAGVNVFAALVIAVLVPIGVAVVNQRLFHVRERLRRTETGASPFAHLPDGPHPQSSVKV